MQVMDALKMDWPEDSFDLVWACESGEHMPDKKLYVEEMTRVLKPGAHLCFSSAATSVTFCSNTRGSKLSLKEPPQLAADEVHVSATNETHGISADSSDPNRDLAPFTAAGGRIIIATWCQREETPEAPFTDKEKAELDFLYTEWAHPYFISIQEYERLMQARGSLALFFRC